MSTHVKSAERLIAAAIKLAQAADKTTPGDWDVRDSGELISWQDTHDQRPDPIVEGEWENDADPKWVALASPALAGPLAAWLEDAAQTVKAHETELEYEGLPDFRWCKGCQDEECDGLQNLDKAFAVADVILGEAT